MKIISKKSFKYFFAGLLLLTIVTVFFVIFFSVPPSNFPKSEIVSIKSGTYLSAAADLLASNNIIKSRFLFKVSVILISGHRQVRAGDYLFDSPQSVLRIAHRTANGMQGLPTIKVTFYEGMTVKDITAILKKKIPNFDHKTFSLLAMPYEGYLFPDTYYFYENTTPDQVIDTLRKNFNQQIKTVLLSIQMIGKPIEDVIKMASIVEKEATSSVDRKIIAGILWKRIEIDMPLQVDPPFYYILGKDSSQITKADLAADSPYNLYKHKGLPPTPIDNPGLSAIKDTINYTKTNNLFFLSDKNGNMHYAPTHDGHLVNKDKYI